MAYLGNAPGVSSQRTTQTFTATAGQTTFSPTSGYTLGYLDVYLNGVRLINGTDYTASNGTTVVLASGAALDDVVEVVAYIPRGLSDGYTKPEADARYLGIDAETLPSQTGESGKYLTTDGSTASWATINTNPTPADVSDQANTSTGYFNLPAGTTAQRPGSPASGMVRFNTEIGEPEWYDPASSQWLGFSNAGTYGVEYLIVAGGGAGGDGSASGYESGGGGAGGVQSSSTNLSFGQIYPIVVGSGGVRSNGGDSSFAGLTSIGGGRGGTGGVSGGSNGGSGGGGTHPGTSGGSGTIGQGNDGGDATTTSTSAGGGGAGTAGQNSIGTSVAGAGGAGAQYSISGANAYYGGGGGGGAPTPGAGGVGGGASGTSGSTGNAGTVNTGGGGGGVAASPTGIGGNGGSGIVIIRYAGAQRGTGGTVTSVGGYTIHTFTSSGSYTA